MFQQIKKLYNTLPKSGQKSSQSFDRENAKGISLKELQNHLTKVPGLVEDISFDYIPEQK